MTLHIRGLVGILYMWTMFLVSKNSTKKEVINMASEQLSGDRLTNRAKIEQTIGSDIEPDVLRMAIKNWDERRAGMRESLPGDRRK